MDVQTKISTLVKEGPSKLHVVSDFDRTLTPHKINGEKTSTSFAQFRNGGYLGDDYAKRAHELYDHYHPLEIDHNLDNDVRRQYMRDWWKAHLDLLVESGVSRDILASILSHGGLKLRENGEVFFKLLRENSIPLLILSAGIGDIIKSLLLTSENLTENVHIISNFFEFSPDGRAVGVKMPVVSAANKDESEVAGSPYASQVIGRKNIILIGDSLDDLQMTHGMQYDHILTIGYLNEDEDARRAEFANNFDIVIEGDGSLAPVNEILLKVLGKS